MLRETSSGQTCETSSGQTCETSSGQTRKTSSGQTKKGLEDCSVILSDSSCKKENIRFTTVPFKAWIDQEWITYQSL